MLPGTWCFPATGPQTPFGMPDMPDMPLLPLLPLSVDLAFRHEGDEDTGGINSSHLDTTIRPHTTMKIKALPDSLTRDMLVDTLNLNGFQRLFDFVYLPANYSTELNFGYALINFQSLEIARQFKHSFDDFEAWPVPAKAPAEVEDVEDKRHQGLDANIQTYRNGAAMHAVIPDIFRPVVFESGMRVPFPKSTARIRPPKGVPAHVWTKWKANAKMEATPNVDREVTMPRPKFVKPKNPLAEPMDPQSIRGLFCAPPHQQVSLPARSWRLAMRSAACLDLPAQRNVGKLRRPELRDRWENAAWRLWVLDLQNAGKRGPMEQQSFLRRKLQRLSSLACLFCGPKTQCSCLSVANAAREALPKVMSVRVGDDARAARASNKKRTLSHESKDEFFRKDVMKDFTPGDDDEDLSRLYSQWSLLNMLAEGESWHRFRFAGYKLWRRLMKEQTAALEEDSRWWPRTPSEAGDDPAWLRPLPLWMQRQGPPPAPVMGQVVFVQPVQFIT